MSTCMEHGIAMKRGSSQPVSKGEQQQRGKEKRKGRNQRKGKEKRKRENKGKGKERERKEADSFFLRPLAFQRSELVGPRSKVRRFDEGYAARSRDSSYFGLFLAFALLF